MALINCPNFLWSFGSKERVGGVYEYSFQAQEHDDEIKGIGNSLDFGARIYDSRTGRWLSLDPLRNKTAFFSPYVFVANNPILNIDQAGNWDIVVHVAKDREKYGYGILIVKNDEGEIILKMKVRVQGTAKPENNYNPRDRSKPKSDTPLGIYDIPDSPWMKKNTIKDRKTYGPNYRLILNEKSGEVVKYKRSLIRLHGGRQEKYDEKTGEWSEIKNPELKTTYGCMRCYDEDIEFLKDYLDALEKFNENEKPGTLTIVDDLTFDENGNPIIPKETSPLITTTIPLEQDKTAVENLNLQGIEQYVYQ